MVSNKPILTVDRVTKVYAAQDGELRALEEISFRVNEGEFVCLVGPSGCGKTTLLRILGGLLEPKEGMVYVKGTPLMSPRREIGFVFQKANLLPWRTVLENVTLPLEVNGLNTPTGRNRARQLLMLAGLDGFEKARPHQLSAGMQQRVAIARALVHEPSILLMDEPFASLDAITRQQMNLELLRIWRASNKTVVLVTHSIEEAVFLADRVLVMSPRPSHIEAIVPIPLPRPRRLEMLYGQQFGALCRQVRQAIQG